MTFDPKHDYEDESSAKARFGGLQQPTPCQCHLCRMHELGAGPVLVPEHVRGLMPVALKMRLTERERALVTVMLIRAWEMGHKAGKHAGRRQREACVEQAQKVTEAA